MSQQNEQVEADAEGRFSSESVVQRFEEFYHVPALVVLMAFMLWVRLQAYDRFTGGNRVLFRGNDAYYHFRQVSYTVNNWPWTMPFDPWTRFSYGTSVGQFGTLFDQAIATAALIVGLGDPSSREVALTLLVAPAVIGALVAIPVYMMGARLHSRPAGLFGALLFAIMPGTFLQRSTVGFADHHVAEALTMTFAIFGMMVALGVAERELPVYEQLLDSDWEGLWTPAKWSLVAGLGLVAYVWVWPPGVVVVGILGIFFALAMPVEYLRGRTPDHLALVATVSLGVLALFSLVRIDTFSFSSTVFSLAHVVLPLAVVAGSLFLAVFARIWDDWGIERRAFPAGVLGVGLLGYLVGSVLVPGLFRFLISQSKRAFGFGQGTTTLTISEAQPTPGVDPLNVGQLNTFLYQEYGLAYVVAMFAVVWLLVYLYFGERYRVEMLLVAVWSAFLFLMALTQVRFHYYLAPAVAVLTAWVFGQVVDLVGVPDLTQRIGDMRGYQILILLAVFMLVIAPLAPPLAAASAVDAQRQEVPQWVVPAGERTAPSGGTWADSGEWLSENTPAEGNYGGAGNEMDYYGSYGETQDFEYPEGAYGVMSWWDYGHWITVLGERIPVANPFQENARGASSFLQSASEERANLIMEAIPSLRGRLGEIDEMSNDELRAIVANQSDQEAHEDTRYVMIDDQTATTKFGAVTRWANPPGGGQYFQSRLYDDNNSVRVTNARYEDTMVYKLYNEDADGLSHYRLVHESNRYTIVGGATNSQFTQSVPLLTFSTSPYNLVFRGWRSQLNNISRALQISETQNRTFDMSQITRQLRGLRTYDASVESVLKTYEYVPGAQVTGRVNGSNVSDQSVILLLNLETNTGRSFRYVKRTTTDEDGRFSVTVPYATDNSVTPAEGGTNTSVRAVGNYSLFAGSFTPSRQFNVSESAIYDDSEGPDVELGEIQLPERNTGDDGSDGNESDGGNQSDGGNESGLLTGTLPSPDGAAGSLPATGTGLPSADAGSLPQRSTAPAPDPAPAAVAPAPDRTAAPALPTRAD